MGEAKGQNRESNPTAFLPLGIIVYLAARFVYRFQEFLTHWYIGGFKVIGHWGISFLERLDRALALQVTAKHIFEPLYQDRTFLGYILGFVFRSLRIGLAIAIYLLVVVFFTAIYLAWIFILPFILYRAIGAFGFKINILPWIR